MSRSTLNDFEFLGKLGSGSFGTVYLCKRRQDDRNYVLKTIPIADLPEKEQNEAINEVRLLASIESLYVVRYYDSFVEADTLHIVMEHCDRGDLKALLLRRKKAGNTLEEDKTWQIVVQIMLGLYDIHKRNVLHRDVKTANVFLASNPGDGPKYLVKVGDLGVAKLLGTSTAFANTVVGTPYYLSPELCEDRPYNDKSDVWALGVVLYECLTGRHPFEARNQCALILKIIKGKYEKVTGMGELGRLCGLCLERESEDRPNITDLLLQECVYKKAEEYGLEMPRELFERIVERENKNRMQEKVKRREQDSERERKKQPTQSTSPNENMQPRSTPSKKPAHAVAPKPKTPVYDRKRIVKGTTARGSPPQRPPQFAVTGIGSRSSTPQKQQGGSPGIRGNRVRGSSGRVVSSVASTRHQRPQPTSSHSRGPTRELGGLGVVGHGSKSTASLPLVVPDPALDVKPKPEPKVEQRPQIDVLPEDLDDDRDIGSLPSTVDEEGDADAVQWAVLDQDDARNNEGKEDEEVVRIDDDAEDRNSNSNGQNFGNFDDIFDEGEYNPSPPPSLRITEPGSDDVLYEVMDPIDDLDRTIDGDEDAVDPTPLKVDIVGSLSRHVEDLDRLVTRATRQCQKLLGNDAFDELHALFRDRFVDEEGRMRSDNDQNEEKTADMHEIVEGMQGELVERCGGLMEACQAVFNVQRLLALEAGLMEAKKSLTQAQQQEAGGALDEDNNAKDLSYDDDFEEFDEDE